MTSTQSALPTPSTTTGGYKVTVDPRTFKSVENASYRDQDTRGFTLDTPNGSLRVAFHAPGVLRLTLGSADYPDYGLVVQQEQPVTATITRSDTATTLTCGPDAITVTHATLFLHITRNGKTRLSSSNDLHMGGGFRIPTAIREGEWSGLSFELRAGEQIYGLGEKFGRVNKRGERVINWNEDAYGVNSEYAYKNAPFAWSPYGWGVFTNTTTRVVHGVGFPDWSHRAYCLLSQEERLDTFVFLGDSPADILTAYANLTGGAPEVPRWSLGVWMSRAYYRTAEEAMEIAQEIRKRQIPCDVFTLDGRAWLEVDTRCTLDFDTSRYPDPAAWIRELKSLHYKLCVWEYPLISIRNEHFADLAAKGYFLKDRQGDTYVYHWDPAPFGSLLTPLPPSGLIDFTNPEARAWYKANHNKLFDIGVDVMKTDFAEQVPEDAYASNGDDGVRHHNAYGLLFNQTVYEATQERGPSGGLVWGRAGWTGSQRYALGWGGDPQTDWGGLIGSLHGGLSWGLSGVPYHSHDIGGFYGPKPDAELYVRWSQVGMLGSHARFHGTTPREPWYFGDEAEGIVTNWVYFRYRLLPYLERLCQEAVDHHRPVTRAMAYAFPNEPESWAFEEQYMLGDALLVAPVVQSGGEVRVYLPEGQWTHLFTGEVFQGGRTYDITAPLEWIPVFGRAGSYVPLGPAGQHTGEIEAGRITQVLVFEEHTTSEHIPFAGQEVTVVRAGTHLLER
ncbi:TIM-barrel domain-containing protein [Deinococcus peraridilitoris]|uniref:Family 31 glycosyl hydrolase, alpha-glucosidase n=1 Tax=Deinococcus peraridilitoris (strain DSM 19664 / LMG 22246 / CIP 109416 / KR-200) TaxID=937777 RepID=L0A831_DEIPD|nr:TIM-barrel domain-containing protein [Deinococcus peraridilitoris]AFZ69342.1 family 31 glycosyl hydrolase, alpha-glucosidase [Deinococcus peraridilitoris DSM 19664]